MNAVPERSRSEGREDDYIDLVVLWAAAWKRRVAILCVTAVVGMASVVVTLLMPNIYQSTALLAPVAQDKARGLSSIAGGLGALAGLAGVSLGAVSVDNTTLAIQTLSSRKFLTEFVKRHDLLAPLFATTGWDPVTRKWVIDPSLYDEKSGAWLRHVEPPATPQPSDWEIFKAFSNMVSVEQDPKTNMVSVSVRSQSPEAAQQWAQLLIEDVNASMRDRDLTEATKSIQYLERRLEQTTVSEIRLATFQLIEDQMKTAMLAEARPEYVFRVLDPPVIPAEKSSPKRALICVLATLIGGLIASVAAAIFELRGPGRVG